MSGAGTPCLPRKSSESRRGSTLESTQLPSTWRRHADKCGGRRAGGQRRARQGDSRRHTDQSQQLRAFSLSFSLKRCRPPWPQRPSGPSHGWQWISHSMAAVDRWPRPAENETQSPQWKRRENRAVQSLRMVSGRGRGNAALQGAPPPGSRCSPRGFCSEGAPTGWWWGACRAGRTFAGPKREGGCRVVG